MQLVLRSALQAPLPLPGSYFAALLAAPSSSGCFCGRGTSLGTRLPFIALNAFRRSLGAALPTHRALSKGAAGKAEAVPHRFLQMDDSPLGAARIPEPRLAALPAAPGGVRAAAPHLGGHVGDAWLQGTRLEPRHRTERAGTGTACASG